MLEASLLKPNMVLPGTESDSDASDDADRARNAGGAAPAVPAAVPGIAVPVRGQSDEQATARLDAINRLGTQPWELSFSFGRALQAPVLKAWAGEDANRHAAQAALLKRARLNGAARHGRYSPELERSAAGAG